MSNLDEPMYDRDDLQYEINAATDNEVNSDAWSYGGDDAEEEWPLHVEPEPTDNIEGDRTIGNSARLTESEPHQLADGRCEASNAIPQILAKEFATEEEAGTCFREYARTVGFGIRKHNKRRNVKGDITGRTWVCSREGFRSVKHMQKKTWLREARAVTRTGCRAQFRVIFNDETRRWACSYFHGVHNHDLTPAHLVHHIRSHRRVTCPDLLAASSLQKVGVKPSQIHEFMVDRSGGYDKVGYTRRDIQNSLDLKRRRELKDSDAQTCLSYLDGRKSSDPAFFYDFTISSSNRLADLFWCDGGSCADYALFGDVIAFDATYKTNAYRKPLVVILGINHHRRTIVFGFALLSDETEETYTWLLETFMSAMGNKHPSTVITDGDKTMRKAINKTFPQTSHRLCCWHVARNCQTNVNNPEFNREFHCCMLNAYTEEEFDRKWRMMVDNHNVGTNEWVGKMFQDRHMWAEAYLRGKFFGGMRSTQRSEGMNAYLNHYVNRRLRLIEFVKQMDRLMDRQREGEGKDDFHSCDGRPVMVTHLKMYEQQAAEKFTRAMFRLVREEIEKEGLLTAEMCDRDIMSTTYRVRRFGVSGKEVKVVINEATKTFSCSCKCLQTVGIPCSHSFAVLKAQNMREIPGSMVICRWTKDTKITAHAASDISSNKAPYMTEQARIGQLYAACRGLLRYAGSNVASYNVAITDIHQLTLRLEAMCQRKEPVGEPLQGRENAVQDPDVVLTKGSVKRSKMGQQQQRKCSKCGVPGHNIRKCKKRRQTKKQLEDCSSQCMEFFCDRNVLGRNAVEAIDTSPTLQQPAQNRNIWSSQPTGDSGEELGGTSDSWLQHLSGSVDGDSTNPTLNTSAFRSLSNYIATSSSAPTFKKHMANLSKLS